MRIFQKECRSLRSAGYNVSLIVADNKGDEIIDGVNIYDIGKPTRRINRLLKTSRLIFRKALSLNCDLYHFHDPDLLIVGLLLLKKRKKVIWDMHENIPADIMQKKYLPYLIRSTITILYQLIEKYTAKKVSGIICTRDSVLFKLHHLNSNIVVINNFPITDYQTQLQNQKENIICFAGAIVPNYQHKEIIEAISEIDDVKYVIAGPVKDSYLNILKKTKGWDKVEYLGILNFEGVKELYSKSRIGIVVHKYTHNMDWQVGNFALTKIFEVMYWGLPVIATKYSLWEETVFNKFDCAITVNPENVLEIRQAIKFLLNDNQKALAMGKNGQNAVIQFFNWHSQEKKLIGLYNKILPKR